MEKLNFAFISALYNNIGADLYRDIYFPIIKYCIVKAYCNQADKQEYYDLTKLKDLIKRDFGVLIPLVVLKRAIRVISDSDRDFSLTLIENGEYFSINRAWDVTIYESIDNKALDVENKFTKLEASFSDYLKREGLSCDKSLCDFFSDNTEEIITYLNGKAGETLVNQEYANVANFLEWIQRNDLDLYNAANDIFWASIIAGFLQRDKAEPDIKPETAMEYYLDSKIVLGLLQLDEDCNIQYARELVDIIRNSGNKPMVHDLTLSEIRDMLEAIEKKGQPVPGSSISFGYYKLNLTPTKILGMRKNLESMIGDIGLYLHTEGPARLDKIESDYSKKPAVKKLQELRNNGRMFREIHDVYMGDFIKRRRNDVRNIEKVKEYFITSNQHLIQFTADEHPSEIPLMLHPSKVVVDLWIHSASSEMIRRRGLAEAMARCFAMNQTDVLRKLKSVLKCMEAIDDDSEFENAGAIMTALAARSQKVIADVEDLEKIESSDSDFASKQEQMQKCMTNLSIHVQEFRDIREGINTELNSRLEKMEENLNDIKELYGKSLNEKTSMEATVIGLQSETSKQGTQIDNLTKENESVKRDNQRLLRLRELDALIAEKKNIINVKGEERMESVNMTKYWLFIGLEILMILVLIVFSIWSIISYCTRTPEFSLIHDFVLKPPYAPIFSICSGLGLICTGFKNGYVFSPKICYIRLKEEQLTCWDKCNPDYHKEVEALKKLEEEKAVIEKEIEAHYSN